ncbi:hypothetical protein [Parasphingorhabdus sp.]|uniref:capsular polysaccharide export protein, LipB/KpsS family n=1 Tax=Parasphingorhabdus sp. TaxID=2709688 RepID=UPI003A8D7CEC
MVSPPVLVYVRPWNMAQFSDLAQGIWPDVSQVHVSEHGAVDQGGLKTAFYAAYKHISEDLQPLCLAEDQIADILLRCRLLRSIPLRRARRLLLAAEQAIEEVLDHHKPRAMLSITVDSYILQIFYLACQRRNIPFYGLVPSFINGYFRLTAMGERVVARDVPQQEIDAVTEQLLSTSYKPDFLPKSSHALRTKARKLWRRNLVKPAYFEARRRLSGDPLNYHYWSTSITARRYWSLRIQDYDGCIPRNRTDLPTISLEKPLIFLPLQMSPEATIDYWSTDTSWIDYEARVLKLLKTTADSHTILVKEHPNLLGFRSPGFYRRLAECSNAILVDAGVSANQLIQISDGVIICTGTVGFEAALRGLPVYTNSAPFHLPDNVALPLEELAKPCPARQNNITVQKLMIRHVLEGLLPGEFINDGSWQQGRNPQSEMINSLRQAIERGI